MGEETASSLDANESCKPCKKYWEQQSGLREKMTRSRKPEAGVQTGRCFRKEENQKKLERKKKKKKTFLRSSVDCTESDSAGIQQ